MDFRTEFHLKKSQLNINHQQKLFLLGSCFSNSLGGLLQQNKFEAVVNPFGTLYDPISIFRILNYIANPESTIFNIVERDDRVYAYELHSEVSSTTMLLFEEKLKQQLLNQRDQLKASQVLFVTLGTATIYRLKQNGLVVANCHKQNSGLFDKTMLSFDDIMQSFKEFYHSIKKLNPQLQLVFTLSPVRHIKDGIEENQVSKSLLRYCISEFCKYESVSYFPSYELVLDDLRDYRFYAEDLIHPNELAIKYIWEKFSNFYFEKETKLINEKWNKIYQSLNHRPFNQSSIAYLSHLQNTHQQLFLLKDVLDVQEELKNLSLKIKAIEV